MLPQGSDIFTPALGGGGKYPPPQMSDDNPPAQCDFFDFLMFFNVNLRFAHVYTPPPNICLYPPTLKFLEITLPRGFLKTFTD